MIDCGITGCMKLKIPVFDRLIHKEENNFAMEKLLGLTITNWLIILLEPC